MVVADARDRHLWPTVGGAWRPNGTQLEGMPPGQHQQPDLAGALALRKGTWHHGLGPRNTQAWFRDRLSILDTRDPADR